MTASANDTRASRRGPGAALAEVGRALVASPNTRRGLIPSLVCAAAIYIAAIPFAGWLAPSCWFAATVALVAGDKRWQAWQLRAPHKARHSPFELLLSAGYSAAATCARTRATIGGVRLVSSRRVSA